MHNQYQIRYCALILGVIFLLLGLSGFAPEFVSIPDTTTASPIDAPNLLNDGYGYLFGLFPVNNLHNAVHLIVGILGLAAFTSLNRALVFLRVFAIAYLLFAVLGLLPLAKTLFATMPIYGNNVWFNALTGAIAGYFGFFKPETEANFNSPFSI